MDFINNYAQQVQLAQGATALALALPNGTYRLTLSDGLGQAGTRWEYVDAIVTDGAAALSRGLEMTEDQAWPADSWIYLSITAATLTGLYATLATQSVIIADLKSRIETLEGGVLLEITVGVNGGFSTSGYFNSDGSYYGSVSPAVVSVPSVAEFPLLGVFINGEPPVFSLAIAGDFSSALLDSADVQGIGILTFAEAIETGTMEGVTYWAWNVPENEWFLAGAGATRTVKLTFTE